MVVTTLALLCDVDDAVEDVGGVSGWYDTRCIVRRHFHGVSRLLAVFLELKFPSEKSGL